MSLDFANEPLTMAVVGGATIGLALALLRIAIGRVMSASAMIGSLLGGREGPAAPSIAFIAGLFMAPTLLTAAAMAPAAPGEGSWALVIAGGLLVGLGARLGGGGLVGAVWRLLQRAPWAATAIAAGVATASLMGLLGPGGAA